MISGELLASGSCDLTIKIWNVDTGECIRTMTGHSAPVRSLEMISSSPRVIASGAEDNSIKLWNVDSGECIKTLTGHSSHVLSLKLVANNVLASGAELIKLWRIDTGECINTLDSPNTVALERIEENRLASEFSQSDDEIRIWDLKTGENIKSIIAHESVITSLQRISNELLVSGSYDSTIRVWNVASGECVSTIIDNDHEDEIYALALLSNDGNSIASASSNEVHIWHLSSQSMQNKTFKGHSEIVKALALIDEYRLASGSYDQTIKIWRIKDSGSSGNILKTNFSLQLIVIFLCYILQIKI